MDPTDSDDWNPDDWKPNKYERQQIQSIYKTLKRYRLSIEELNRLKLEYPPASKTAQKNRREYEQQAKRWRQAREAELAQIEMLVKARYQDRLNQIDKQLSETHNKLSDQGFFSTLFTSSHKELTAVCRSLNDQRLHLCRSMQEEIIKEQAGAQPYSDKTSSRDLNPAWWDMDDIVVLRKQRTYKAERKTLAEELGCSCWKELIDAAIDQVIRKEEENDKLNALRMRAASNEEEIRKIAEGIKKQIAHQLKYLSVCPYCGVQLDAVTAHADHIYPVAKGGLSTVKNMVYVCGKCNLKKADATLNQFLTSIGFDRAAAEQRLSLLGKDF